MTSLSPTVFLDNRVAGVIVRLSGGRLRFDYDDQYRREPRATPLSVSMPVQVRSHPDSAISAWLSGLLANDCKVIQPSVTETGNLIPSLFSTLFEFANDDYAGGARIVTTNPVSRPSLSNRESKPLTDQDIAGHLKRVCTSETSLNRSSVGSFGLTGTRPKIALVHKDNQWSEWDGSSLTTHILKPASDGFAEHGLNEHLCLDAARRAGLMAAKSRVVCFENQLGILIDRFDRRFDGSTLDYIHQEDMCQAFGLPPSRKYERDGGPSPVQIARLLRRVMPAIASHSAVERFVDGLIWNWIVVHTDAHARKYSLLLAGRQIRLTPLYGIRSSLAYSAGKKKMRFAMIVGGDDRIFPFSNPWFNAAQELGLDPEFLLNRVSELATLAPDVFLEASGERDVAGLNSKFPSYMVDKIAERSRWCIKLINSTVK